MPYDKNNLNPTKLDDMWHVDIAGADKPLVLVTVGFIQTTRQRDVLYFQGVPMKFSVKPIASGFRISKVFTKAVWEQVKDYTFPEFLQHVANDYSMPIATSDKEKLKKKQWEHKEKVKQLALARELNIKVIGEENG